MSQWAGNCPDCGAPAMSSGDSRIDGIAFVSGLTRDDVEMLRMEETGSFENLADRIERLLRLEKKWE